MICNNALQNVPCNSAFLAQETLSLTQKSTFLPKVFPKVRKLRQILISRQNSVGKGLEFLSKSKLFGATSATLIHFVKYEYHTQYTCTYTLRRGSKNKKVLISLKQKNICPLRYQALKLFLLC